MKRIKKKHCAVLVEAMKKVRPATCELKKYENWRQDAIKLADFLSNSGVSGDRWLLVMEAKE